ncbi:MAG: xanthine phosphoribosyltransferase [Oscillospiraceae bacterium]|nr:xanthine phosphoribosyltransferase [Oscillospiraceae bacterium]
MKQLEERILRDGKILPGGILKVDGFLNHRIDPRLLYDMAQELRRLYAGEEINKILTIEASGIAIAAMVGYVFGCPLLFAKKSRTRNISDKVWSVEVESFTHGNTNTVIVSKEYLGSGDRVLIVDDFLATGAALVGLKALCEQAGAAVVGAGIAVEKVFQGGGNKLRAAGLRVESLAKIASMGDNSIEFCE